MPDRDEVPFVDLESGEIEYARYIGERRLRNNEQARLAGYWDGTASSRYGPHVWGAIGELAAHTLFGLDWHPSIEAPDHGGDVAGWVEVKTREKRLFAPTLVCGRMGRGIQEKMQHRPFLLALVAETRVTFPGWTWGRLLLRPERWGDHFRTGHPCWLMEARELRPTRRLMDLVARHVDAMDLPADRSAG